MPTYENVNVIWYYCKDTDTFADCSLCVKDDEFKLITSTSDAKSKGFTCRWCKWNVATDGMIRPSHKTSGYDHLVNMWSNLRPKH
jgi:hypothetical protein